MWYTNRVKWYGVISIATHYRLDGPGFKSQCWWDFPDQFRPALKPTQPLVEWLLGLFPGDKATRAWCWQPPSSSAKVVNEWSYTSTFLLSTWHITGLPLLLHSQRRKILSTMANKPSSQPSDIRTVFQPHRNKIFLLEPIVEVFNPFTIMTLSPKDLKKKNKIK